MLTKCFQESTDIPSLLEPIDEERMKLRQRLNELQVRTFCYSRTPDIYPSLGTTRFASSSIQHLSIKYRDNSRTHQSTGKENYCRSHRRPSPCTSSLTRYFLLQRLTTITIFAFKSFITLSILKHFVHMSCQLHCHILRSKRRNLLHRILKIF